MANTIQQPGSAPYINDDTRTWVETFRVGNKIKPGLIFRAATDSNYINGMTVKLPCYGYQSVFANAICNIISPGQRIPGVLSWSTTESIQNITQTASLTALDALPISTINSTVQAYYVGSELSPYTLTAVGSMASQWCSTTIRSQWVIDGNGVSQRLNGNARIGSFVDPSLSQNQYGSHHFREDNLQYRVFEPEVIQVADISKFPDPSVPYSEQDAAGLIPTTFNEWWNVDTSPTSVQGVGAYYILVDNEVMRVTRIDRANRLLFIIPGGRGVSGQISSHSVGTTVSLLGFRPFTSKWTGFGYLMPHDYRIYQSPFRPGTCFCSYEGYGDVGQSVAGKKSGLSKVFDRANNMCFTGYWFTSSPEATLDDTGVPQVTITLQSPGHVVNEQQICVDTVQRSANLLFSWADTTFDEIGYTRKVPSAWTDYAAWDPTLPGSYPLAIHTQYGMQKAFFDHMNDTTMGTTCQECQNEYLNYIAQYEGGVASGSIAETRAVGKHVYQEAIMVFNSGGQFNAGPLKTYGRLMTALAVAAWDNPLEGNALGTRWTKMPNALFNNMVSWCNGRVWNGQLGYNFYSQDASFVFSQQTHDDEWVYGCRVPLKCPFQATYDQQPWSQPGLDLAALNNMTYTFNRQGYPVFIPIGHILRGLPNPSVAASMGAKVPKGWFTDAAGNEIGDTDTHHGNWNLAYGASIDQFTHTVDTSSLHTMVYVSCQTAFGDEIQFTVPAAGTGLQPNTAGNELTGEMLVWYSSKVGNKEGLQFTGGVQVTDSVTMDNLLLGLDWNTQPASWGLTLIRNGKQVQVDAQPPLMDPRKHGNGEFYFDCANQKKYPNQVQKIQRFVNFMIERRYIGPAVSDELGHITFGLQIKETRRFDAPTAAGVTGTQQFLATAGSGIATLFTQHGSGYRYTPPHQTYFFQDNIGQWGQATYEACKYWLTQNAEFIQTDIWWYVQNGLPWDQYVAAIVGLPVPQYQDAATSGKWTIDQLALTTEAQTWLQQFQKDAINYGNQIVDTSINQATTKTIQSNMADPRIELGDVIWAHVPGYMTTANAFGSSNTQVLNGIYVSDITRTMDLQQGTYTATYQGYRYSGNYENNVMLNANNYCSRLHNEI